MTILRTLTRIESLLRVGTMYLAFTAILGVAFLLMQLAVEIQLLGAVPAGTP